VLSSKCDQRQIRVLQVASGTTEGTSGGVASFLFNFYKEIDKSLFKCDFLAVAYPCFEPFRCYLEKTGAGIDCLNVSNFGSVRSILVFVARFKHFLQGRQYDIIHLNEGTLSLTLLLALVAIFYGKHLSKKRRLPHVMYMRRRVTCFYHNSCKSTHVIFFKCDYLVICRNFEHLDNAGYEFVNLSTIGRI